MSKKGGHLYLRVSNALIERITGGIYVEGSLLPSERELCDQFEVSRTTVRQALQELSQKGYAKSLHGKGTVIVRPQIRQDLTSIYSFDEDMRRLGKAPKTQIMDFVEIVAPSDLANLFEIPEGSSIYRIMRLRLADGDPMLLETNYLPCDRFPGFQRSDLENKSLYQVLSQRYGLSINVAEETFEPVQLRPMDAQMLGVMQEALGMLVERVSYENGKVVEVSKSISPSFKFKHHVVLKR